MVHYDSDLEAATPPPQICPKCGSHRTEIVGRSTDGEMVVLRCNACGERSRITIAKDAAAVAKDGSRCNNRT